MIALQMSVDIVIAGSHIIDVVASELVLECSPIVIGVKKGWVSGVVEVYLRISSWSCVRHCQARIASFGNNNIVWRIGSAVIPKKE